MAADLVSSIIYAFAALFVILDPILSVPIFAGMTKGQTSKEIHKQAFIAVAVAGILMYIFLVFNTAIFNVLGLTLSTFQVAGGILLFLLGMEMALGIDLCKSKDSMPTAAGVVIGTPILCGPGAITTVMLLSKDYGILVPFIAITLCLAVTWIILYYSAAIQNILGTVITDIMGRVLGMLVAAIAIKIIFSGIIGTLGLPIVI
ncbi:MarC family protein [Methanoregula sp. UBA64]|jgi:multiple antibiotic resistance protein|uniref:MarC family protein n=1 Tax=Methanoregula sp. UBA64 TaxID=1915554 RepID=UPI0025E8F78F|nr:MarC family protein [Methanoregula sp. UBA64]